MTKKSWWKAGGLVSVLLLVAGCASAKIRINGPQGSISHPSLKLCPGTLVELTVRNQQGAPVTVQSRVAAGQVQFDSRELKRDVELTQIVTLELRVVHVPSNPGTAECPFHDGDVFTAGPLVLRPVAGQKDTYTVNLDEFHPR